LINLRSGAAQLPDAFGYRLSEPGPSSSRGASGCGVVWFRSFRGRPGLSGCSALWPATWWSMGRSAGNDSGRSVFGGPPPVGGSRG